MSQACPVAAPTIPGSAAVPRKHIPSVVVGNALEVYDFVSYAYFAVYIGAAFFPSDSPSVSLMASLATFGAGFVTRPIGAIVIGRIGDRIGRKPAMLLSFGLMGVAILGLCLVPPYASIGITAPILVVFFRLLQGFALGGETGTSTTYLFEIAPPHRRGLYVSLQYTGQAGAGLLAGLVGFSLAAILGAEALGEYGWRIAMLVGVLIIPMGLYMRRSLPETLHQHESVPPQAAPTPGYARVAILGLVMLSAGTTVNYVLKYMTTYAIADLKMSPEIAYGGTILGGIVGMLMSPLGGWLSDRYGRKPVMLVPWIILLVAILPAFYLISHYPSAVTLYASTCFLGGLGAMAGTTALLALTEELPKRVRSGVLSLVYAFAISIFGGTAQFNVAWLIDATGNVLAPAWYMMTGVALGLGAMVFMRETAPVKTGQVRS